MKKYSWLWRKPYGVLTLAAFGFWLISYGVGGSIDIHLHDTYLVLANSHVYKACALLLVFFAFLHKILSRLLFSRVLTWLHVGSTIGSLIFIMLPVSYEGFHDPPRQYYDYSAWEQFKTFEQMNRAVSLIAIFGFLVQLSFLLHILLGFLRLFTRRR